MKKNTLPRPSSLPAFESALTELLRLIPLVASANLDLTKRRTAILEAIARLELEESLRHHLGSIRPAAFKSKDLLLPAAVAATVLQINEHAWVVRALEVIDKRHRPFLIEELIGHQTSETAIITQAVVKELVASANGPVNDPESNALLVNWLDRLGPAVGKPLFALAEDPAEKPKTRQVAAALLGHPTFQIRPAIAGLGFPEGFDVTKLKRLRAKLFGDLTRLLAAGMLDYGNLPHDCNEKPQATNAFNPLADRVNVNPYGANRVSSVDSESKVGAQEEENLDEEVARLVAWGSAGQSYEEISSGVDRVRTAVSRGVARRLEFAIKAELPSKAFATFEDKKSVAHWLNDELRRFDLAIASPKTGQPARIKVATARTAPNGFIQIVTDLGEGRWNTKNCSTIPDLVEVIAFVDAPTRREGLKDWRGRVSSESESSNRGGTPG